MRGERGRERKRGRGGRERGRERGRKRVREGDTMQRLTIDSVALVVAFFGTC